MNVLVLGSGGREHALAWKLAQSPKVETVFVAPGNAGTAAEPGVQNVALDPLDFPALTDFVRNHGIGLTVVGPEAPLVADMIALIDERPWLADGDRARLLDMARRARGAARPEALATIERVLLEAGGLAQEARA
jgi:phosphoribosylamine--glycine ligase